MKVIRLEEIDSTNTYAKTHMENLEDKTVIHALRQTKGRGRFNRTWIDLGSDNLFISIVLKPDKKYSNILPNITQYACVVLCRILEKYGVNPKIKWPNDVMIDGTRKISGILSETVIQSGEIEGIIIGIGVNLNSNIENVKAIPDRIATSLNIEIGKSVDMDSFLQEFLTEFFDSYDKFLNLGFNYIKKEYLSKNCFLRKDLKVQVLNEVKCGYARDITNEGELILEQSNKEDLVLTIGDIL